MINRRRTREPGMNRITTVILCGSFTKGIVEHAQICVLLLCRHILVVDLAEQDAVTADVAERAGRHRHMLAAMRDVYGRAAQTLEGATLKNQAAATIQTNRGLCWRHASRRIAVQPSALDLDV